MSQAYSWFLAALKHMIEKKMMSREDLKEKAETTRGTISMVYNERRRAGAKLQEKLAKAFGYSLGDFILVGRDILEGQNSKIRQITPEEMEVERKAVLLTPDTSSKLSSSGSELVQLLMQTLTQHQEDREERDRWKAVVEAISDSIVIIKRSDMTVIHQNQAHRNLVGGDFAGQKCKAAFADKGFCDCIDECPIEKCFADGKSHIATISTNGQSFSLSISPIRDASNVIVSAVEVIRDITAIENEKRKSQATEELYRSVLDSHPDQIIRYKPDLTIIYASESMATAWEMNQNEMVGKNIEDLVGKEFAEGVRANLAKTSPENPTYKSLRFAERNNIKKWMSCHTECFYTGDTIQEIQTTCRDVTSEHEAKDLSNRRLYQLNAVLKNSVEGIVVVAEDDSIRFFNQQFTDMFEIKPSKMKHCSDVLPLISKQLKDPEDFEARCSATKENMQNQHSKTYHNDGRIINHHTAPIVQDGEYKGFVAYFQTVTEEL